MTITTRFMLPLLLSCLGLIGPAVASANPPEAATVVNEARPGDLLQRLRDGFALPVQDNPRIRAELRRYRGQQAFASLIADRARPFLHFAVQEAERRQLPTELALLPVIESAYDPTATSRSNAAGIWQFIPSTGDLFGLQQNYWYDDRRDPLKSTLAAYDYLAQLHAMFNDWALVLAAYNAGPGTVSRAIQHNLSQGRPTDYWSLQLPQEAMDYVPRFLAVTRVFAEPDRHGVNFPALPDQPYFLTVRTSRPVHLTEVARQHGIELDILRRLNAGLRRERQSPDGPGLLHLPVAQVPVAPQPPTLDQVGYTLVTPHRLALPASPDLPVAARQESLGSHVVQAGETLFAIARGYLTSVQELVRMNRGLSPHRLEVGQVLQVPVLNASVPAQASQVIAVNAVPSRAVNESHDHVVIPVLTKQP